MCSYMEYSIYKQSLKLYSVLSVPFLSNLWCHRPAVHVVLTPMHLRSLELLLRIAVRTEAWAARPHHTFEKQVGVLLLEV